ncbi:MAG: HNH endonuclease [Armatimonadetes bacterium]|nr:HNH endonuclease [Armatimonadota bacterium]
MLRTARALESLPALSEAFRRGDLYLLTADEYAVLEQAESAVRSRAGKRIRRELVLVEMARASLKAGSAATQVRNQVLIHLDAQSGAGWYETDRGVLPAAPEKVEEALGSRTILLTGKEASPPIEMPVQELLDLPARSSTGKKTPRPAVLRALFARAGGRCEKCRGRGPLHVHHRRPWSDGGSHHLEDLEARCAACHAMAHRDDFANRPDWHEARQTARRQREVRRAGKAADPAAPRDRGPSPG